MAKKKNKTAKPGPQIYIGPTLPGGTLAAHTIFKNGLPPHVEQLQQEHPEIKSLIVSVSDLSRARQRIAGHGKEAQAYRAIVKKYFG